MIVVALDRQEGKTARLIEWASEAVRTPRFPHYSRVIVVPFPADARHILANSHLSRYQVVEFATFRRNAAMYAQTEIGVDNAEYIIEWALGIHNGVKMITINTGVRSGD